MDVIEEIRILQYVDINYPAIVDYFFDLFVTFSTDIFPPLI
jgi:hypothetical protein